MLVITSRSIWVSIWSRSPEAPCPEPRISRRRTNLNGDTCLYTIDFLVHTSDEYMSFNGVSVLTRISDGLGGVYRWIKSPSQITPPTSTATSTTAGENCDDYICHPRVYNYLCGCKSVTGANGVRRGLGLEQSTSRRSGESAVSGRGSKVCETLIRLCGLSSEWGIARSSIVLTVCMAIHMSI